jgi:hypothetical protein
MLVLNTVLINLQGCVSSRLFLDSFFDSTESTNKNVEMRIMSQKSFLLKYVLLEFKFVWKFMGFQVPVFMEFYSHNKNSCDLVIS